jgi:hypothetical protein
LGSPERALVDTRGLLTPRRGGWSIDWWIGAEDRWHLPSREAAVRQTLIDGAPVVETSMRVPGGDAVICHYAWESPSGPQVVIEVDNRSASPFALALAVRPSNVDGPSPVHRLQWRDRSLRVDGGVALVLATSAQDVVLCDRAGGDALDVLMARNDSVAKGPLPVSSVVAVDDPTGGATAAVVVPVAHRTLMRALVPLGAVAVRPGALAGRHRRVPPPPGSESGAGSPPDAERFSAASLPAPAVIAAGWNQQTERKLRMEWPAGRLADAVTAQRHYLHLTDVAAASRPDVGDAEVAMALVTSGARIEAGQRLTGWVRRASASGDLGGDLTSTSAVLCALELHDALERTTTADSATIAAAAEAVARASAPGRSSGRSSFGLSSSVSIPWAMAGLAAAARLFDALGESRAAGTAREWVNARQPVLSTLVDPYERVLAADLGMLDPAAALDAVRVVSSTASVLAGNGGGRSDRGPNEPYLAARPAMVLAALRVGLRVEWGSAWKDLDRFLASASRTWTWPDAIDPPSAGGVTTDGHSSAAVAGLWQLARDLFVRDQPAPLGPAASRSRLLGSRTRKVQPAATDALGSISICTWFPDEWRGQNIELNGLPTRYGTLSYALRWHGNRPALLWEMADAVPGLDLRLCVPGLDSHWNGQGLRGDALLAAREG